MSDFLSSRDDWKVNREEAAVETFRQYRFHLLDAIQRIELLGDDFTQLHFDDDREDHVFEAFEELKEVIDDAMTMRDLWFNGRFSVTEGGEA